MNQQKKEVVAQRDHDRKHRAEMLVEELSQLSTEKRELREEVERGRRLAERRLGEIEQRIKTIQTQAKRAAKSAAPPPKNAKPKKAKTPQAKKEQPKQPKPKKAKAAAKTAKPVKKPTKAPAKPKTKKKKTEKVQSAQALEKEPRTSVRAMPHTRADSPVAINCRAMLDELQRAWTAAVEGERTPLCISLRIVCGISSSGTMWSTPPVAAAALGIP